MIGQDALQLLRTGQIHELGRIPESSNSAALVSVSAPDGALSAVAKPLLGESPLSDFPPGTLASREVATYACATALGIECVPPTAWRADLGVADCPGPGSLQAFVHSSTASPPVDVFVPEQLPESYAPVFRAELSTGEEVIFAHARDAAVREVALFDVLINNADRKGWHLIRGHWAPTEGEHSRLFAIDHGLTFHPQPKLRTVLWGFAGLEFTDAETELVSIAHTDSTLHALMTQMLGSAEADALCLRAEQLLKDGTFPLPPSNRSAIPWPLL